MRETIFSLSESFKNPNLGSIWGSSELDSVFGRSAFGELQNLLAKEEDLYGADLQRVNNKAFLGGEEALSTLVLSK